MAKKLKFSFSSKALDRVVTKLQALNSRFHILSKQTRRSVIVEAQTSPKSFQRASAEVKRYEAIGKASRQVYEALCKACNKHTEHLANFRVEAESCICKDDHMVEVKFNMAFSHHVMSDSAPKSKPIWFLVNTRFDEQNDVIEDSKHLKTECEFQTRKRQQKSNSTTLMKSTVNKRVRFDIADSTHDLKKSVPIIAHEIHSTDRQKRDFCDHLRRRFCPPLQTDVSIILERTRQFKHIVMPSAFTLKSESQEAVSLSQLIGSDSTPYAMPGLISSVAPHQRIGLAKALVTTVLQLHATPWIGETWSCKDILFFGAPKQYSVTALPDLSAPHLSTKVTERSLYPQNRTPTVAQNPLLFSLCAVLLELAFASNLENLWEPCDGARGNHSTYATARRLAKGMTSPMGAVYNGVVEQLLMESISSDVEDLGDARVQRKLHERIVCPLEEIEQKLRNLYISSDFDKCIS